MSNKDQHEPDAITSEDSPLSTGEHDGHEDQHEATAATDDDARAEPAERHDCEEYELDADELVGPGEFPLRVQPAAAIMPGQADARRLLRIWFVRKSFYWLFLLGSSIAVIVAAARSVDGDIDVEREVSWPWSMVILAFAVRFISGWVALGLALPLALAHEPNLSPRTNFGSRIGMFFDRLHIARAFRALRWTHHVRQVAQHRLGERGRQLGKLDPIFDIINIASGVLLGITIIVSTFLVAS